MSLLFSPVTIKEITFRNRIVISPMCEYSSIDGFANDWHLVHLGSRAVGGAALIIQEATAVSPEGRISPDDMGIWKNEHIEMLSRIVRFIQDQGAIAGIQLAHAGRKASVNSPWKGGKQIRPTEPGGWKTVGPSAIPFFDNDDAPLALNADGIQKVIDDFRQAATRALQAGYKVVEIHAAHGYLLHEFLSTFSNHRSDEYGGNFENRIRLLLQVIDAVHEAWPNTLPLFVRISATDWSEGGWDIEQSVKLSSVLKDKGVDVVDCSSGGNVPGAKIPIAPGYQVQFAERIKKETSILTGAVGLITTATQSEEILANKRADLIVIARQSLRDPYFPMHAAKELGDDIHWPNQYLRAK